MPKFKKNPNPIRQNFGVGVTENPDKTSPSSSGFKMKYKHSAFPFKNSPAKQPIEGEIAQHTHVEEEIIGGGEATSTSATMGSSFNPSTDIAGIARGIEGSRRRRTGIGQL